MATPALERSSIDAFAPTPGGVYRDGVIEVRRQTGPTPERRRRGMVRTASFDVERIGPQVHVVHRVPANEVDDDLAGRLAAELFGPGWLRGSDLFERLFVGIVLTSAADPLDAWEAFYRQTLDLVDEVLDQPDTATTPGSGHGGIADYAPVYAFVERLLATSAHRDGVLELGCCFGFLSLRLARAGWSVVASDLDPGSTSLLAQMSTRLDIALVTRAGDASAFPAPDRSADHVLLVHLLEHVDADVGSRVLAEALRLARHQVVIGVPLEDEADQTWGHLRTISLTDLDHWGRGTGLPYSVHEHHGGWLVIQTG